MAAQRITNRTRLKRRTTMQAINKGGYLNQYGVPAFNISNMEQVQAIMQAADETDSPVILQASAGEVLAIDRIGAQKYAAQVRAAA
jgi:fructose/tagatose bisphosphate aldolase